MKYLLSCMWQCDTLDHLASL